MQALTHIGTPAREGLEASLTFYDASVARLAAGALGQIADARSVPALVDMIAGNRTVSREYPEMLDAIKAAVDSLDRILTVSPGKVSQQNLERFGELPEEIQLSGSQPARIVDCTHLRNQAVELLRRAGGEIR